jgi:peptide/nickel transport system substrate-binding protein
MFERNRWAILGTALLAAGWASGCGTGGQAGSTYVDKNPIPADTMMVQVPEPGRYGGRFVVAAISPPKTFNYIASNETSSSDIGQRLFVGLADYDNGKQAEVPMIAKSWEVSPDQLTYTFHMRRGARFSDGHPITSADVLFCFEVCYDEKLHPSLQDLLKIDGQPLQVTAPDSYTVVIRTPKPYALMIPVVGAVRIMPKHMLEPYFRRGEFASAYNVSTSPDSIVTSGPWRVKQYASGEKTVLERNPHWFGFDQRGQRMPYLDELVFLVVPDMDGAILKFQSGEVDAVNDVKADSYKLLEDGQKQGNYTLYDLGPALSTNFFFFNLNRVHEAKPGKRVGEPQVAAHKYAWFSKPEFRRAVSMAVDREGMIRSVMFGDAVKNWSTSTPGNKWHTPEVTRYDYDPEKAKQLIAGLGWKDRDGDGFVEDQQGRTVSFTLKTNSNNPMRVSMAGFVKDDLAKIGIKVVPQAGEFNTLIANLRDDFQYEAALLGLQSGVPPDPGMGQNVWRSSGLTHYWHIKQPRPETPQEAEINRLMDENLGTNDETVRRRTWTAIQNIVNEQCWVIWLPTIKARVPVRNKFGNLQPVVIPHRIIWNIERVFWKPGGSAAA